MLILGIETSCDETSASVVENGTKLLSLVTATSQDMHQKYGGIIPDHAAREQLKSALPVIHEALFIPSAVVYAGSEGSRLDPKDIDAVAVTVGPGLIGSLLIGVETAKTLALAWNKPIIPINHLIGHIYANWIDSSQFTVNTSSQKDTASTVNSPYCEPTFPALILLVSGGHTELILMKDHGQLELLGSTLDDAAGECFDKCGRLLGLPYPYGPFIEKEAEKFTVHSSQFTVKFPRPMINSQDFDFSFSGLKTAFLNEFKRIPTLNREPKSTVNLTYELQEAITDVLVQKTLKAAQKHHPKSILLAGGVAANKRLREKIQFQISNFKFQIPVFIPPLKLCTDNAAVIASAAFFNNHSIKINKINADPSLNISSTILQ